MEQKILKTRRSYNDHIEYQKECEICNDLFWAKKIDGTCCTNACRNLKRNRIKNIKQDQG